MENFGIALAILAGFGLLAWAILRHGCKDDPRRADDNPEDYTDPPILRLRPGTSKLPPDGPDEVARKGWPDMPIMPERWKRDG